MQIHYKDFIANENVKAALTAAFVGNRLPQAIIIQGEEGLGKKTLSKIIANIAVCTSEDKPCGTCSACKRALAGSHPDIRIESGSGVSGNISVESVRNIIEDAQKKPEEADLNVYLLFVKNRLSPASQNKLLKIIEEPPGRALFIIAINSADSLLPTIRSRAICLTLLPAKKEEAAKFYSEKKDVSYSEALEIASLYSGNIGLMFNEKPLPIEFANKIAENFDDKDEDAFLALCYPLIKDRANFALCMEYFRLIIRDALMLNEINEEENACIGTSYEQSLRISNKYRKVTILKILDIIGEYTELSKRNLNMNLLVTSFCAKIRDVILK